MQLAELLKDHPKLSKAVEVMLDHPEMQVGEKVYPGWPDDVLLPFGVWMAIEKSYHPDAADFTIADRAGALAAVGTWRYSKGVYRLDKALYDAIVQTDLPDTIPMGVFRRLPDWCPYIELPEPIEDVHGYYVYLDYEYRSEAWELRIYPDSDKPWRMTVPLELTDGAMVKDSIFAHRHDDPEQIIDPFMKLFIGAEKNAEESGFDIMGAIAKTIEVPLKILLYLCSDEPEIDDSREPGVSPGYTRPKKAKGGYRLFEPSKVRTWEVGRSISRTLSAAIRATGGHKSPHIRRAHWHGYWTGQRGGDRKFIYHWLPPTAVAIDQLEERVDDQA